MFQDGILPKRRLPEKNLPLGMLKDRRLTRAKNL